MTYDITRLKALKDLDVENAAKRFIDYSSYFNELSEFIKASKFYLRDYTPTVVIYSDAVRKDFLANTEKIKNQLTTLGMFHLTTTIDNLNLAVSNGSVDSLSDSLLVFYSELDIMAKNITSTYTINQSISADENKPIILSVDDKPEILTTITDMLKEDFTVMCAVSGEEAIEVIEKHTPRLFLLDIEMPQMNGFELANLIRNHRNFIKSPIIFLTGKKTREYVLKAIDYGANAYLIKPVNKELLLNTIKKYL